MHICIYFNKYYFYFKMLQPYSIPSVTICITTTNLEIMEYVTCSETGQKISRGQIIGCISDAYKSAWGFRPRYDYTNFTMEELGEELNSAQKLAEDEWKREVLWEREARKERRRSEKRYQRIRTAAKSAPAPATYTIGEMMELV